MSKLGLIGYPLSHSLSKVIQETALKTVGLEGQYDLLETHPEDLVDRVKHLKAQGYDGFNVTIPHKVPITLFVDKVDEQANIAGAVNTVKILPDKSLYGYNTDIYGFVHAIDEQSRLMLKNQKAAVFGTGGAARAVGIGLAQTDLSEIDFYSRNLSNSQDMIDFLRRQFPKCNINLKDYKNLVDLSDIAIVVNSTPIGMKNHSMNESLLSETQLKTLKESAIVYDIVYNPIETLLLKNAKKCGLKTINGLDMLLYQAIRAFEIWTGETPNFDKMKISALEALLLS